MNNTKRLLVLLLALALVFVCTACQSGGQSTQGENGQNLTHVRFVLEWTPNTNHTGVYVAQALGYYEEQGLEVEILTPPDGGAAALVAAGSAEFGVAVQENIGTFLAADEPMPITAIASIIDHNTSGLISLKEKGIDDFSKLEGKNYATWNGATELAIIKQVMADAGSDFDKLVCVPAPSEDAVSMIQMSDIDVAWVYEAWDVQAAELAGVDYNFIRFSDISPVLDYYTPVIIGNNQVLEENPELAKAFMAATAKGYEYCIQNPKEAADILVQAVPELTPELVEKSMEFLANEYKAEKEHWGTIDEARWTAFFDWMYEQGLIDKQLGSQGFTNEFLPQ